jgi:hypothetical protein
MLDTARINSSTVRQLQTLEKPLPEGKDKHPPINQVYSLPAIHLNDETNIFEFRSANTTHVLLPIPYRLPETFSFFLLAGVWLGAGSVPHLTTHTEAEAESQVNCAS